VPYLGNTNQGRLHVNRSGRAIFLAAAIETRMSAHYLETFIYMSIPTIPG
jgi:hypothetical protein